MGILADAKTAMDAVMAQIDAKGLIRITALKHVQCKVTRKDPETKKNHAVMVTLYELDDAEFIKWMLTQLEQIDSRNRLRFRLYILFGMANLGKFRDIHWKPEDA